MPDPRWRHHFHTSLGQMRVVSSEAGVVGLGFVDEGAPPDPRLAALAGPAAREGDPHGVAARMDSWLAGAPTALDALPLDLQGTPFQRTVWAALQGIPRGETRTYGQLARELGRKSGARAVGAAVGRNPVAVVVPCHRVVGARGRLTGYAWGIGRKRRLLRLEGAAVGGQQVGLFGAPLCAV